MFKILYTIFAIITLCACNIINPERSDFVAEKHSYVNKIDLLKYDQKLGIKRDLKKITEETVNTNENVHKKTITINETLEMQGAKGDAQAVLVFDSASQQRSGDRSINLTDDGSVSLDKFVKKFETSQYKSIPNDKFSNNVNSVKDDTIQSDVLAKPFDILKMDNNNVSKDTIKMRRIKIINKNFNIMGHSKLPNKKPIVTMKPVAHYDNTVNKVINAVSLKPINEQLLSKVTSKPTPIHTWL